MGLHWARDTDSMESVTVAFPLRGEWTALHTPAERVPSHGTDYFGQRYAFDFARLMGPYKKAYAKPIWHHLAARVTVDECYGWGEPVFAPFEGHVIAAGDGWSDRRRLNLLWDLLRTSFLAVDATADDYRPLTGNYILLEGDPGVALLAHLRNGSVEAAVGRRVKEGEQIAAVGNSGNSTTPHLHFHIMDGRDPFKARGVMCRFSRYERLRSGKWEEVFDSVPEALEPIRA
jgi:hypothetical protein